MKNRFLAVAASLLVALAPLSARADKSAGDMVDDTTINASVKAALVEDKTADAGKVNVETYQGAVQLSGFVNTKAGKDAAGRAAKGVKGVRKVYNDIGVQPETSTGTKLDDTMITGKVKAALMDDADVKSMKINVETKNGVTQLAGFVPSSAMKSRAGKVATAVKGVKKVDNVLIVK